jgi:hypothetical protein
LNNGKEGTESTDVEILLFSKGEKNDRDEGDEGDEGDQYIDW